MEKKILIFLLFIVAIGIITWFLTTSPRFSIFPPFEGHDFCKRQGYDTNSYLGDYSEKYGKIECVSCYKENCIYEEFNVTKDWRGRLRTTKSS